MKVAVLPLLAVSRKDSYCGRQVLPLPRTVEALNALIENQIPENLQLEYKASKALSESSKHLEELAKDVSAFANSDGGILIYGIPEDKTRRMPLPLDEGVEFPNFTAERLEQLLQANIRPRITGLDIATIKKAEGRCYFSILVPKSFRAPHQQHPSLKYFKRHQYNVLAMEDYELSDVRSRAVSVPPLVNLDVESRDGFLCYLTVANIGKVPAFDIKFSFVPEPAWRQDVGKPPALQRGIKCLPPGKKHWFPYRSFNELLAESNIDKRAFTVAIEYHHPNVSQEIREEFTIDFEDYRYSSSVKSDVSEFRATLDTRMQELTKALQKLNSHLDCFDSLAGASGLNLSFTTVQAISRLLSEQEPFDPITPRHTSHTIFQEFLGVDVETAMALEQHFWDSDDSEGIDQIPGMGAAELTKFTRLFKARTVDS